MPWKSTAQARWGHSSAGVKALGGLDKVKEWDAATPKGSLPQRAPKLQARHVGGGRSKLKERN